MFRLSLIFALLVLVGCQTAEQKRMSFVQERVERLKPLSTWPRTWCHIDATLTQPARARYEQMFPNEKDIPESFGYTWKASEARCEVTPLQSGPVADNHKGFVEEALCTLLHVHYVNSPFDELKYDSEHLEDTKTGVRISTGSSPDLGMFVDREPFVVETKTKNRGVFTATYGLVDNEWRPTRLQHSSGANEVVLDQFEYSPQIIEGRRMLSSAWLSVGVEKPLEHTHLVFSGCQKD